MSPKAKKKPAQAKKKPQAKAARAKAARKPVRLAKAPAKASKPQKSKAAAAKIAQKVTKIETAKLKMTQAASKQDLARAASKLKGSGEAEAQVPSSKGQPAPAPQPARSMARPSQKLCLETGCEAEKMVGDYCRVHYIRNWRKIKRKEVILKERKLDQYVEELINKYPEKYIEAIQQDLANDRDFSKMVHDLELNLAIDDEEGESDSIDTLLDNIRKDIDVSGGPSGSPVEDDEDLF